MARSKSPGERRSFERSNRISFHADTPAPVNHALSRITAEGGSESTSHTSSPLKRSDAIMNLDQASLGSPVAKRRSLHGSTSFGHDFNVFDHGPPTTSNFDIHDDGNHEYELSAASVGSDATSYTSLPRRSSSLRKSTLQQRHGEKTSWGRRQAALALAAQQMAQTAPEVSTPVKNTSRPRLSLDQFVPPLARDSPFNNQGSLPSASVHLVQQPVHQPHPLSRTMTTSSSNSSLVDESPTHIPPHFGEKPRPKMDFSKSLPIGALRPMAFEHIARKDGTFETPQNYKNVKPHAAAFMSTGLVSKMTRNPEVPQASRAPTKAVPDTPCKKPFNNFATYPAPMPGSAIAKARHIRHSFGTPSTPFNPHGTQVAPETFGKGAGIFGSSFGHRGLQRRGSFLSVDGYESDGSPNAKGDSQTSDFDFPGTPTKHGPVNIYNGSPSNHRSLQASMSALGHGLKEKLTRTSSKLNLSTSQDDQDADDSDGVMDVYDSPTMSKTRLSMRSSDSLPSFSKSRALRSAGKQAPAPLIVSSDAISPLSPSCRGFAKVSRVLPASPLERATFMDRLAPHTPRESMLPPDPSGLSISNAHDGITARGLSQSMPPPATPTGARDYHEARRYSTTPVSTFAPIDLDHSLLSRFDQVEEVGFGEFSQVYKVTQKPSTIFTAAQSFFNPQSTTPSSPAQAKCYAVKKANKQFQGVKDREMRLQEVHILKALGKSDHVIELFDWWEERGLLYIQTEYCDEGALDFFLRSVGSRGALDVFRTWKILLEIGKVCLFFLFSLFSYHFYNDADHVQGLQHIHESGFIHLDLKPANIFITFEGSLKIGDFGLATTWPAPAGIDREGDRTWHQKPCRAHATNLPMSLLWASWYLRSPVT
jgi:mitosis inhibitor protein kinase SWE1